MPVSKPFLILQLRPEDDTSDSEFAALLKYGGLQYSEVRRIRIEKTGIPELVLDDYSAVIIGGSPFDISTPESEKSTIQKTIEQRTKGDVSCLLPPSCLFFSNEGQKARHGPSSLTKPTADYKKNQKRC